MRKLVGSNSFTYIYFINGSKFNENNGFKKIAFKLHNSMSSATHPKFFILKNYPK